MSNVIPFRKPNPWREAFSSDGGSSTLQVYVNDTTGQCEVVQTNDEGEAIRTMVDTYDTFNLSLVLDRVRIIPNEPKKRNP